MTTITSYGSGALATSAANTQFKSLKDALGTLQTQLSTGKVAQTYSGLGTGAVTSLTLSARLGTLNGYSAAISNAQTRVKLASTVTQQISSMAGELASTATDSTIADLAQRGQAQIIAQGDLAEIVDSLNTDINGSYIFSGRATDTQPVASLDTILNGNGTLKGLKSVVDDRIATDLGGGEGGLTTSASGSALTLGVETSKQAGYGFTVSPPTSSNPGSIAITAATAPDLYVLNVAAQPSAGDTISLTLTLPDSTTTTLTLTAAGTSSASGDTFAVGATTGDTVANMKAALDKLLSTSAQTDLAAASTMQATKDFFNGQPAGQIVSWYNGGTTSGSPRDTAVVQVGDNQSVGIGVQANETGFKNVLIGVAALALGSYTASNDTLNVAKYNALSTRAAGVMTGASGAPAIDQVTTDLANASVTLGHAADRASATTAQVQDTLDSVENADPTKVSAQLLAVQTQLQASYQVTATIAKLSLTDYLS